MILIIFELVRSASLSSLMSRIIFGAKQMRTDFDDGGAAYALHLHALPLIGYCNTQVHKNYVWKVSTTVLYNIIVTKYHFIQMDTCRWFKFFVAYPRLKWNSSFPPLQWRVSTFAKTFSRMKFWSLCICIVRDRTTFGRNTNWIMYHPTRALDWGKAYLPERNLH